MVSVGRIGGEQRGGSSCSDCCDDGDVGMGTALCGGEQWVWSRAVLAVIESCV